jgi:hypothetical protein
VTAIPSGLSPLGTNPFDLVFSLAGIPASGTITQMAIADILFGRSLATKEERA